MGGEFNVITELKNGRYVKGFYQRLPKWKPIKAPI